jgi:hypothetical protein
MLIENNGKSSSFSSLHPSGGRAGGATVGTARENQGAGLIEARLAVCSFQIGQQILRSLRLGRLNEMWIEPAQATAAGSRHSF